MPPDPASFVAAYGQRLGLDLSSRHPDLALLREIHAAHVERIPFENVSIHLGEPLTLDPEALAAKILDRRRGGFCYELNGLLARLLVTLGYGVSLYGARVWGGDKFGPPLDHLVLDVVVPGGGERWLADVGFGDHSVHPLPWRLNLASEDPGGVFELKPVGGGDVDLFRDDRLQYRIEPHRRELADFSAMCWYQATSPESHFTKTVVCTRFAGRAAGQAGGTGRITLTGRRLIVTSAQGRDATELAGDDEVLAAYRDHFGLHLDRVPTVVP